MISVVYSSRATGTFSPADLTALLEQSRADNARRELSGLLLYKDGQFMQALEGPEDAVRGTYEKIAADPRHGSLRLLIEERISARQFPEWSMGFRELDEAQSRDVPGFDDFFSRPRDAAAVADSGSRARMLLDWFRVRSV